MADWIDYYDSTHTIYVSKLHRDVHFRGIARDIVLVHMGSQSNLFAAMAWTLVHLLERPALLEAVPELRTTAVLPIVELESDAFFTAGVPPQVALRQGLYPYAGCEFEIDITNKA